MFSIRNKAKSLTRTQVRIQQPEGLFIALQQKIDSYLADCTAYKVLASAIDKAQLDCQKLKQLTTENPLLISPAGKFIALKQQLDTYLKNCKREQLKLLPKFLGAKFVPGFATFTPETKERALKEIQAIGTYLSLYKNATVLVTLHTPVSGPSIINNSAINSGLKTTKDVLDARFNNVADGLMKVPGVSRNQIKKDVYQFNKPSRIVKFKMIPGSPE